MTKQTVQWSNRGSESRSASSPARTSRACPTATERVRVSLERWPPGVGDRGQGSRDWTSRSCKRNCDTKCAAADVPSGWAGLESVEAPNIYTPAAQCQHGISSRERQCQVSEAQQVQQAENLQAKHQWYSCNGITACQKMPAPGTKICMAAQAPAKFRAAARKPTRFNTTEPPPLRGSAQAPCVTSLPAGSSGCSCSDGICWPVLWRPWTERAVACLSGHSAFVLSVHCCTTRLVKSYTTANVCCTLATITSTALTPHSPPAAAVAAQTAFAARSLGAPGWEQHRMQVRAVAGQDFCATTCIAAPHE